MLKPKIKLIREHTMEAENIIMREARQKLIEKFAEKGRVYNENLGTGFSIEAKASQNLRDYLKI